MEMSSSLLGFQYKTKNGQTHDCIVSPKDIRDAIERCERLKKLFARGVAVALDKDYIDIFDVCDALGLNLPYGYDGEFKDDDEERTDRECQAIWDKFDQQFVEFFGMTIDEASQ